MKAIVLNHFGDTTALEFNDDVPVPPVTSPTHVQIKLSHASINPVDYKIRKGAMKYLKSVKFPHILGRDGCGQVTAVGTGVTKFKVGDKVLGLFSQNGGYAQFVTVEENELCIQPDDLDNQHAAGLPLIGLSVYQMYQNYAPFAEALKNKTPGTLGDRRVLVIGASGGTGSIAVLLAKHYFGSTVYAVCSGKNAEYVKSLGADYVIDYTIEKFVDAIPKLATDAKVPYLDLVLDCAGGDNNKSDADTLMGCHGMFVTIAPGSQAKEASIGSTISLVGGIAWEKMKYMVGSGPSYATMLTKSDGDSLGHLVGFLLEKNLVEKIKIDNEFPLSEIQQAHALLEKGRTVGKVIITIPE
jgi:NADPH:quinone reductase-like Zn-dependent oxidoreductase